MSIIGVIRNLSLGQLWKLTLLCSRNVWRLRPTWRATRMSVSAADKIYGKEHQRNTPANAFRHALWNFLVAKNCFRSKEKMEDVLHWTKQITDLHEDLFPNGELARAMDLHNNRVGRNFFQNNPSATYDEIVTMMKGLTSNSLIIYKIEELNELDENQLVHIETMTES